jgi:capsular exopolysaccharide synthesis family protein
MGKPEIITVTDPRAPIAEAYRTLRTNIQFSSFDKKIQTIVVTSSGPGEGKSTTSSNLAVVLAEGGNKTILIDCDQRKPKLHKLFFVSNNAGLSDLLVEKVSFEKAVQKTEIENLSLLTSGTKPPNPSELLASAKMKNFIESLKETYDYIILDTPPVIAVTDAQLLSSHADGCLLVIASAQAERAAALKAKELLYKVKANILGVVLNKLEIHEKGYYGYYYSYYYGEDKEKSKSKTKTEKPVQAT